MWPSRAQAKKKAGRLSSFAEQSQYPCSSRNLESGGHFRNLSAGHFQLRQQSALMVLELLQSLYPGRTLYPYLLLYPYPYSLLNTVYNVSARQCKQSMWEVASPFKSPTYSDLNREWQLWSICRIKLIALPDQGIQCTLRSWLRFPNNELYRP